MAVGAAVLAWVLAALAGASLRAGEPAKEPPAGKPPWQRLLQKEDARKAAEQEKQLLRLQEAGKFEGALKVAEALAISRTTSCSQGSRTPSRRHLSQSTPANPWPNMNPTPSQPTSRR
jgi:hypothetical protein